VAPTHYNSVAIDRESLAMVESVRERMMTRRTKRMVVGAVSFLVGVLATRPASAEEPQVPTIAPDAERVLRDMGEYLKTTQQLSFHADITYDDLLPTGQKIQLGATYDAAVRRPDRIYTEYWGDSGGRRFWYDGKAITLYDPAADAYATEAAKPTIDGRQLGQPLLLLRLRARKLQRLGREHDRRVERHGRRGASHFLGNDAELERRQAEPTVLFGNAGRRDAELDEALPDFVGVSLVAVQHATHDLGRALVGEDLADLLLEQLLVVGEIEVHDGQSLAIALASGNGRRFRQAGAAM
jgi:hypothetical protein